MSKKKKKVLSQARIVDDKSQNFSIDYEKLAEALIHALEQVEINKSKQEPNTEKKTDKQIGVFTAIGKIIKGKANTKDRMTVGLMAIPLALLFKFIAIVVIIGDAYCVKSLIQFVTTTPWRWNINLLINNTVNCFLYGLFILMLPLFAILLWGASNEMDKAEDKQFVVGVFSGIVSFTALIISYIALKG